MPLDDANELAHIFALRREGMERYNRLLEEFSRAAVQTGTHGLITSHKDDYSGMMFYVTRDVPFGEIHVQPW